MLSFYEKERIFQVLESTTNSGHQKIITEILQKLLPHSNYCYRVRGVEDHSHDRQIEVVHKDNHIALKKRDVCMYYGRLERNNADVTVIVYIYLSFLMTCDAHFFTMMFDFSSEQYI